jgi:hypothetical protein
MMGHFSVPAGLLRACALSTVMYSSVCWLVKNFWRTAQSRNEWKQISIFGWDLGLE